MFDKGNDVLAISV